MPMFLQPPSSSTGSKSYLIGSVPDIWRARIFYRGSGVVLQFVGDNWVRVGVFTEANKTPKRHHQGSGFLHAHHAFFRRRHGFVPAALPRHLSPIVTPAPSLGGSLTLLPLGVT